MYEITSIYMYCSAYIMQIRKLGEQDDHLAHQDVHAHAHVHPPPARNSLGEGRGGISQPSGFHLMHVGLRLDRVVGHSRLARARTVCKPVFSGPRFLLGAQCPGVHRWR